MGNKKWFYLVVSVLCIAAVIGGYVFGYKPYEEKKVLRIYYSDIVSIYDDVKAYQPSKDAQTNKDKSPLLTEKKQIQLIQTILYEMTGKMTTNNNKIALNLMQQATEDLDKLITTKRSEVFADSGEKSFTLWLESLDQQKEFETKILPKIKGYVE